MHNAGRDILLHTFIFVWDVDNGLDSVTLVKTEFKEAER